MPKNTANIISNKEGGGREEELKSWERCQYHRLFHRLL